MKEFNKIPRSDQERNAMIEALKRFDFSLKGLPTKLDKLEVLTKEESTLISLIRMRDRYRDIDPTKTTYETAVIDTRYTDKCVTYYASSNSDFVFIFNRLETTKIFLKNFNKEILSVRKLLGKLSKHDNLTEKERADLAERRSNVKTKMKKKKPCNL